MLASAEAGSVPTSPQDRGGHTAISAAGEGVAEAAPLPHLRSQVVRLNVGGTVYVTTAATLSSRGENFFTALLREHHWTTVLEDGSILVDRNGALFGVVLDFLRTGRLVLPPDVDWYELNT